MVVDEGSETGLPEPIRRTRKHFVNQRNAAIKLYGLPWAFPGWLGTASPYENITQTADYIVRWLVAARDVHQLNIDFIGVSRSVWPFKIIIFRSGTNGRRICPT